MKTWVEPEKLNIPPDVLAAAGGERFLAEILLQRGLNSVDAITPFLDPDRYRETPPDDLPDIDRAVERLQKAITESQPILIWGDYDVDGQTATTLLYIYLQSAGAKVSYHIPVRATEGHGIQPDALKKYLKSDMRLLITCDTGISEVEGVQLARQAGLDVIITDHHNLPDQLAPADFIINPKLLPAGHGLSDLAGVGVAYKLIQALDQVLNKSLGGAHAIDLVALGTIADMALLVEDNRYMVQKGLPLLNATQRVGLQAVYKIAGILPETVTEEVIGYNLAPRLNAVGRLADANRMVELLSTDDAFKAELIANEIEGLNAKRRLLSDQVLQAAIGQVERDRTLLDLPCLVLAHPSWPGGILGIVASTLVETYNRPVILLANPPGSPARGSARSIPGIDITSALEANHDLLLTFGGHPMAAGLSLLPEKLVEFQAAMGRTISHLTGETAFEEMLLLDAVLPLTSLPENLQGALKRLSPFGPGNPPLTLMARSVTIQSTRPFGRNRDHLRLTVADESGKTAEVTYWRSAGQKLPEGRFDLAYSLKPSSYLGHNELQITWVDHREQAEAVTLRARKRAPLVHDYRLDADPLSVLQALYAGSDLLVWREGSHTQDIKGVTRYELKPADRMAVWTIPSSFATLRQVIDTVKAREIHLFASQPEGTRLESFQTRLAGLIKFTIVHKGGTASIIDLAVAMAHEVATVEAGLEWLNARGDISFEAGHGMLIFKPGGNRDEVGVHEALTRLLDLLAETAAFHAYYLHAAKQLLVD
ncbi:MAG: single-stranded-DNA-specific exonuclease RecJ [Anaerolineaceae bacterium]